MVNLIVMKKHILFIFFTLRIISNCFAEERVGGQIFWRNDSVTYATFVIPGVSDGYNVNLDRIQEGVNYYDSGSGVEKILKPEEAKEIRLFHLVDTIRMVSNRNTIGVGNSKNLFLQISIEGRLKLFIYYAGVEPQVRMGLSPPGVVAGVISFSSHEQNVKPVLQKDNGDLFMPTQFNFKKVMKTQLADCKEVVSKIIMEEYTYGDMRKIVRVYNNCKK